MTFTNPGTAAVDLKITPLAYAGPGEERTISLKPGHHKQAQWHCDAREGWYDLRVTCEQDATYTRRLMGHIENGRPSVSG
ncbi:phospholipase domain-containing protein [Sphaerisporangium siamense]|uniref:phospholipase domain-containing protein n=1 Tax=Sphaerisporangium siamense TaxID=795645 RepID=UPI0021A9A98A|nr:phospholipase domain-containing protein [Sphaerisporangium siamense]